MLMHETVLTFLAMFQGSRNVSVVLLSQCMLQATKIYKVGSQVIMTKLIPEIGQGPSRSQAEAQGAFMIFGF